MMKAYVGDVFVEVWGYDQTNVDAYVVVRKTARTVYLKPCGLKAVGSGMSTRLVPDPSDIREWPRPDGYRGKVNKRGEIAKRYTGGDWISMTSFSGARLWDRQRSYYDTHAAGLAGH